MFFEVKRLKTSKQLHCKFYGGGRIIDVAFSARYITVLSFGKTYVLSKVFLIDFIATKPNWNAKMRNFRTQKENYVSQVLYISKKISVLFS